MNKNQQKVRSKSNFRGKWKKDISYEDIMSLLLRWLLIYKDCILAVAIG